MKKNKLIYCILGLIICGVGVYFLFKSDKSKTYTFSQNILFSEVYKVIVSDIDVIKVNDKIVSSANGGQMHNFIVSGLKEGIGDVTIEIVAGDTNELISRNVYHFKVDKNLNVTHNNVIS